MISKYVENFYDPKQKNRKYQDSEQVSKELQAAYQFAGDFMFNALTVQDLYNSKENGANVDAFFIKKSIAYSYLYHDTLPQWTALDYGFHGDDLNYLFGTFFCNGESEEPMIPAPCVLPNGENFPIADKRSAIASWNYYFRGVKGHKNKAKNFKSESKYDYQAWYTELNTEGEAIRRNDFYSKEMDYVSKILMPTFELLALEDHMNIGQCPGQK